MTRLYVFLSSSYRYKYQLCCYGKLMELSSLPSDAQAERQMLFRFPQTINEAPTLVTLLMVSLAILVYLKVMSAALRNVAQ